MPQGHRAGAQAMSGDSTLSDVDAGGSVPVPPDTGLPPSAPPAPAPAATP